jgi:hypothetical protein
MRHSAKAFRRFRTFSTVFAVNSEIGKFCRYQYIALFDRGSMVGAYVYLSAGEAG